MVRELMKQGRGLVGFYDVVVRGESSGGLREVFGIKYSRS